LNQALRLTITISACQHWESCNHRPGSRRARCPCEKAIRFGINYGLLFQRKSYDIGSALGWGMSYGFFWWILGPLTLMPMLLGAPPQWTVEAAAGTLGSLIGHLIYGAGLGITFYLLEARHNPWWIPVRQVQATRIERRKAQVFTAAPALWVMVVIIALTIPVVLGM
jgi:hypothetical protein